jgi:archaemetzincin
MGRLQRLLRASRWRATTTLAFVVAVGALGALVWWRFWPHAVRLDGVTIEVTRLGAVDQELARAVAEGVSEAYGVPCRVSEREMPLPNKALDSSTGKYRAEILLGELRQGAAGGRDHLLGLTEANVSVEDWNFVFGLAEMPGTTAVMSLAKLRPKGRGPEADRLLRERAVKIAVHELGHTFGFRHCSDERCVMSFTQTAAGVDRTDAAFCANCRSRLQH